VVSFAPKSYMHSSSLIFVLNSLPISYSLTWSFWLHLVKGTSYEAHYAVFYNLPSLHPSLVQIFWAPHSQTPSVGDPPLMSETKFHTQRKPKAKF
jgi:hypothetical protein